MLYPSNNVNKIINRIVWVTQKNIEVEENRALKKEELKEKIRKNSLLTFIISQKKTNFLSNHHQVLCSHYCFLNKTHMLDQEQYHVLPLIN